MLNRQKCGSTCAHCAREWWQWLKGREANMRRPRKGERVSFAEAAVTSVRPKREGSRG